MAIKHHCDVCDAVTGPDAGEVEIEMRSDASNGVSIRGFVKVQIGTAPGMICDACVKRLFLKGLPVVSFPCVNIRDTSLHE